MTLISKAPQVFPAIAQFLAGLAPEAIPQSRKELLHPLIEYLQEKIPSGQEVNLNFICTHNSRRSHLAQIWAQCIARYFHLNTVYCYSSGTEATALFPGIVETLAQVGFRISTIAEQKNPIYSITYSDHAHPIIGFSKTLAADFNPKSDFAALLVCDSANESCPLVTGAEKRLFIPYEDPKAFDHTALQAAKYQERSLQIATELYYVFAQLAS